ncbi:hypothetical protein DUNSADRAFT_13443, partial [Dunaliella salina]
MVCATIIPEPLFPLDLPLNQGALQTELNEFLATATEGVGEGHTGQQAVQQAWYLAIASLPCVRNVCEIGFNAGHSST